MGKHAQKVRKKGRRLRYLNDEALHELRKKLKKLRYATEIFGPIYRNKKVTAYHSSLKALQDTFGSLNDVAMANEYLTGPKALDLDDPDAQRAVGWVLGRLAAKVVNQRPQFFEQWERFTQTKHFWT
jgi:CHAD domain-containing protein